MRKLIIICTVLAFLLALWTAQNWYCQREEKDRQMEAVKAPEEGARPWPIISALPVILVLPALRWRKWFFPGKHNHRMREFCLNNSETSKLF